MYDNLIKQNEYIISKFEKILNKLSDLYTIILKYADLITDILCIIKFYERGYMMFYYI